MDNADVAGVLEEIAVLLELKGENPFKTRAYINGARVIENLTTPLSSLVKEARLHELKGFGEALQQKVSELVTVGSSNTIRTSRLPSLLVGSTCCRSRAWAPRK